MTNEPRTSSQAYCLHGKKSVSETNPFYFLESVALGPIKEQVELSQM